jgi:hypothetical protein
METEYLTPSDEPELEALIREGLARPALADRGFAARVLRSLEPQPGMSNYRAWLRLSWAGAGSGFLLLVWACGAWWGRGAAYPRPDLLGNAWLYVAFAAALMACLVAWKETDSACPD